ncbi:MAG: TldD/PmbA family protein [Microthrixaceae bacterium]
MSGSTMGDGLPRPTEDLSELVAMAERLLDGAAGEEIEVVLSRGASTSVEVHDGEVESFTSAGSAAAGVRVLSEGRLGFASCGTLDPEVLRETVAGARQLSILRGRRTQRHRPTRRCRPREAGLVVPEVLELGARDKVERAIELERQVIGTDPRVGSARSTSYDDGWGESVVVSTTGIRAESRGTTCSVGTQPLANADGETQIGWGYDVARRPDELDDSRVVRESVERATKLLGAGKPPSARMAILLEPRLAVTLLGVVTGMLSAESVQKGRSPFADRVGETIAAPVLGLVDDPTRSESLGAEEFDGEGLACRANPLISAGVLQGFLYDSPRPAAQVSPRPLRPCVPPAASPVPVHNSW